MTRLAGKVALITGGTRGIGLAIAQAYLAEGAQAMLVGSAPASFSRPEVARLAGDRVALLAADLDDPASPERIAAAALERFGALDILVNSAGMAGPVDFWSTTPRQWDSVLTVNLRAAFFIARACARTMRERGGSIVNLASVAGQIGGVASGPAYVASKAGIAGLTRSLARHLAPNRIRVNAIAPADIETDMTAGWPPELRARLIGMTPLGRFGMPQEVAALALYLAEDASMFVTGQTFNINGGLYMG